MAKNNGSDGNFTVEEMLEADILDPSARSSTVLTP